MTQTSAGAGRRGAGPAQRAATRLDQSRVARVVGRGGLVARSVFYFVLAYLILRVAFDHGPHGSHRTQANAHGALQTVAADPFGLALLVVAAIGFFTFGAVRCAGAFRSKDAPTVKRLLTAAQGVFYLALTWVPLSFVFGNRSKTGSEQQQQSETATVLSWPGGRELVIAVGLVVIGVAVHQIRSALTQDFTDGFDMRSPPPLVRRLIRLGGTVGIAARALVFVPVGVLLVVAAVQFDPQHAKGLDTETAVLARSSWWGPTILCLVAAGLVVFGVYSLLEARYRKVGRAE